jgi:hypothetical protein
VSMLRYSPHRILYSSENGGTYTPMWARVVKLLTKVHTSWGCLGGLWGPRPCRTGARRAVWWALQLRGSRGVPSLRDLADFKTAKCLKFTHAILCFISRSWDSVPLCFADMGQ